MSITSPHRNSASQYAPVVIPAHDGLTKALPPGRYLTTFNEIQDRFVTHDEFSTSTTRVRNYAGLRRYVEAWEVAESTLSAKLLLGLWIAGSFVTAKRNPNDIDVTPIYDLAQMKAADGRPGAGRVKKLIQHRDSIVRDFYVEAFPLPWVSTGSSLFPEKLPAQEQNYLLGAGGLNDWWQRTTRSNELGTPLRAERYAEKGYLEVIL